MAARICGRGKSPAAGIDRVLRACGHAQDPRRRSPAPSAGAGPHEGGRLDSFQRTSAFGPFVIIPGDGKTQMQPILREDAARCVVEAIGKADLLGKIVELGGPEVVTSETIYDWFLKARGIKKPKLHVPAQLLTPGAAFVALVQVDPIATPDEIASTQLPNIADGLDSVTAHFGWRPSAPSTG